MDKLKAIANVATAMSALAAAIMVFLTFSGINERAEKERIANWQKPVIYGAISEKPGTTFREVKTAYLSTASQLQLPIPPAARQDDELHRAILHLLEVRVIEIGPGGKYFPTCCLLQIATGLNKKCLADWSLRKFSATYLKGPWQ